eukprot:2120105-Rhodomonas_salina.1
MAMHPLPCSLINVYATAPSPANSQAYNDQSATRLLLTLVRRWGHHHRVHCPVIMWSACRQPHRHHRRHRRHTDLITHNNNPFLILPSPLTPTSDNSPIVSNTNKQREQDARNHKTSPDSAATCWTRCRLARLLPATAQSFHDTILDPFVTSSPLPALLAPLPAPLAIASWVLVLPAVRCALPDADAWARVRVTPTQVLCDCAISVALLLFFLCAQTLGVLAAASSSPFLLLACCVVYAAVLAAQAKRKVAVE